MYLRLEELSMCRYKNITIIFWEAAIYQNYQNHVFGQIFDERGHRLH